jgi:hypothetical protein
MTELLTVTPRDMGAEPFRVEEIDAHPDARRIWASILAVREAMEGEQERTNEEAFHGGYEAGLYEGGRDG